MTTIAFLGLGHMGGPMAANLLVAGHTVRGFDPVPTLKAAAADKGAQVFDSGAAAVEEADVVITSLPNGDIVKACYAEVLPAAREGVLFIDTSTISVDDARTINQQATERGFAQLDAPVSGGVKGATAGTLAFMVGGDAAAVDRARPVLEPMAGKIIHCGASGTGQAAKLCNNMVLAVQQIAVGEAFVLAEKLGLSAQSLFDVITGATGNCWAVHTNCPVPGPVPTSPANNDFKPGFATALMNKDIGLAMDAVNSTGSSAPLGTHAAEIYAKFAADHADKDFSAVIEMLTQGLPALSVSWGMCRDGWPEPGPVPGHALSAGIRSTTSMSAARATSPRSSKSSRAVRSSKRVAVWRRASLRAADASLAGVGVGVGCGHEGGPAGLGNRLTPGSITPFCAGGRPILGQLGWSRPLDRWCLDDGGRGVRIMRH